MNPNEQKNDFNQSNKFMPPAPEGYHGQRVGAPQEAEAPRNLEAPQLPIEEHIAKRKKQAKLLIVLASVFTALFVLGIVILAINSFGGDSGVPEANLTTDEQLKQDLNTLGLGIINFTGNSKVFTIETDQVAELRVSYLPLEFNDPRTNQPYTLTTEIPKEGELQYIAGGTCSQDDSITQGGNKKDFAIRVLTEGGTLYCLDRDEITQPKQPKP